MQCVDCGKRADIIPICPRCEEPVCERCLEVPCDMPLPDPHHAADIPMARK